MATTPPDSKAFHGIDNVQANHLEMGHGAEKVDSDSEVDRPIVPQPSNDPNDPLNWSWREKHLVLAVVSWVTFQSGFDAGSASSGFIPQSKFYGCTIFDMLVSVSVLAVFMSTSGLFWVPLSHRFGRTPIYLISSIIAMMGTLAGALVNNWAGFVGSRVIVGIGGGAGTSLGSLIIKDMFFVHERGQKIGIWTMAFAVSPYLAVFLDGFVVRGAGWRWMMWVTFFMWCTVIPCCVFLLPETRYQRTNLTFDPVPAKLSWLRRTRWKKFDGRLTARSFYKPLLLWKYPSIIFPSLYYGLIFGFTAFGTLGMLPLAFTQLYHFGPVQQGLMSLTLLIGTIIGEPLGGPLGDWMMRRSARKNGGVRKPEARLQALWISGVTIPIGLAILSMSLAYVWHWVVPSLGIILFSIGTQISVTVAVAYSVECYDYLAGECGLIMNLARQLCSFNVFFYLHPFIEKVGYGWVFGTWTICSAVLFSLILSLMFFGATWRQKLGMPPKVED